MNDTDDIARSRRRLQRLPDFLRDKPHWSHTATYRRAADRPGLLVKMGRATLVNLDVVDEIEATFPAAVIRVEPRRTAAPAAPVVRRRRILAPELVSASES
jgi:hypothetical protein